MAAQTHALHREMSAPATSVSLQRIVRDGEEDLVAVEEPLEIRVNGEPIAVTMRTPGHDEELAAGFLYTEQLIDEAPQVRLTDDLAANIVEVRAKLRRHPAKRHFYTTSSCGVCGKGAIEQVLADVPSLPAGPICERGTVARLPERLIQPGFTRTGGLHATGLFDPDGQLLIAREDVGRHNAMDEVVGAALLSEMLPLHQRLLCVSGRLSFELVQKAAVAGAPILVGVGAPSSLAISLAREVNMSLCGFARHGTMNVYTGPERLRG